MKKVTVRKAQQKITSKALGMPIAAFVIDVLCLRDRFSAVTVKKGKNSEFSTVDMCVGIIAIIMLECERMSHIASDNSILLHLDSTPVHMLGTAPGGFDYLPHWQVEP